MGRTTEEEEQRQDKAQQNQETTTTTMMKKMDGWVCLWIGQRISNPSPSAHRRRHEVGSCCVGSQDMTDFASLFVIKTNFPFSVEDTTTVKGAVMVPPICRVIFVEAGGQSRHQPDPTEAGLFNPMGVFVTEIGTRTCGQPTDNPQSCCLNLFHTRACLCFLSV